MGAGKSSMPTSSTKRNIIFRQNIYYVSISLTLIPESPK